MKLDRLLEITILLMNREILTAPKLAERFGVSPRTIYRDVDTLSSAGVPVYMVRGAGGGITLMEGFTLPKTIVSKDERESILFSLETLRSTRYPNVDKVLEKLTGLFQNASTQWISVDFSPWGSGPQEETQIRDLRDAILNGQVLKIAYISMDNHRTIRDIEPIQLMYKSRSWYLRAWCRSRNAERVFRLSRIKALSFTGESFDREHPRLEPTAQMDERRKPVVHLVMKCWEELAYRLYDDYDETFVTNNGDGTYTLEIDFPEDEWVYGFILSFGAYAEVLSPPALRDTIRKRVAAMGEIYQGKECIISVAGTENGSI